jgi:hypothetical protein
VLNAQLATLALVGPAHLGLDASLCQGTEWEAAIAELRRVGESTVRGKGRKYWAGVRASQL